MWSRENTCKAKNCKARRLNEPDYSNPSTGFKMPENDLNQTLHIFECFNISDYCFRHDQDNKNGEFDKLKKLENNPKNRAKFWKKAKDVRR